MRGPWRRNRTWCPCGVLGNHAFVCISTLLCPLPPPRHVCILSSSTFPSVWRRRFNFLPSYLIIPIVSNFSLISSLILDFGFWIFSQICFFSSFFAIFRIFLVYINFYFILLFYFYIFILFYLHINFYCLFLFDSSISFNSRFFFYYCFYSFVLFFCEFKFGDF